MKFDEWFEQNKDELDSLLQSDKKEALYLAWIAAYEAGLNQMGNFMEGLWKS